MAIGATAVFEVRATGSDSNGGLFIPGSSGTDYSQQAAAQYSLTGLTSAGAGSVILTASASADMPGNGYVQTGGVNFTTGTYQIISVVVGVSITVDRAVTTGVGSAGTAEIGGAKLTMETVLNNLAVAGNTIYWLTTTRTVTSAITITADGTVDARIFVIAYTSDRSRYSIDRDSVEITSVTNSSGLFSFNGASYLVFRNIEFTHTAATRGVGWSNVTAQSNPLFGEQLTFDGCLNSVLSSTTTATSFSVTLYDCELKNSTASSVAFTSTATDGTFTMYGGSIHDSASNGITRVAPSVTILRVLVHSNVTGINNTSTTGSAGNLIIQGCTIAMNSADGINIAITSGSFVLFTFTDNIVYGSGDYGIDCATAGRSVSGWRVIANNALGGNTAGNLRNWDQGENFVTLSADPFTNSGADDYTLNNTAGAGALCRNAGTGNVSLGALEPVASGGSGLVGRLVNSNNLVG